MFPYSRAVANATVVLNAGSRTGGRDTFLCLSKEKYRKETTPQCRVYPCASALNGVFRKGLPALTENAIRPGIAPSGRTVQILRCSARHKGDKTQASVSVESRSRHRRHRDGGSPVFPPPSIAAFGEAKESISAAGPNTGFKHYKHYRVSDSTFTA
jgi:hypothetical protein